MSIIRAGHLWHKNIPSLYESSWCETIFPFLFLSPRLYPIIIEIINIEFRSRKRFTPSDYNDRFLHTRIYNSICRVLIWFYKSKNLLRRKKIYNSIILIIHVMIPFHRIYSWLFKSFRISSETELIDRLIEEGEKTIMIVKRSWIFWLFIAWLPLVIIGLSWISIYIAITQLTIDVIRYPIIIGNILLTTIIILSTLRYITHFRDIHGNTWIVTDVRKLRENLHLWDTYFIHFFDWSITNQVVLFSTIIIEIILVFIYRAHIESHIWILTLDVIVMFIEMIFLKLYRKRMVDLEMDYNVIIPGKIFFVNQSGVLSSIQTIESDKIKTVRSAFPSKIASFFNYWTVDILTEWDNQGMMGTMSMYYVTNPDEVVANIQSLLDKKAASIKNVPPENEATDESRFWVKEHSYDTRSKIRDVLQ